MHRICLLGDFEWHHVCCQTLRDACLVICNQFVAELLAVLESQGASAIEVVSLLRLRQTVSQLMIC